MWGGSTGVSVTDHPGLDTLGSTERNSMLQYYVRGIVFQYYVRGLVDQTSPTPTQNELWCDIEEKGRPEVLREELFNERLLRSRVSDVDLLELILST